MDMGVKQMDKEWIEMVVGKLEIEIQKQRKWSEDFQRDFIEECLRIQGDFAIVKPEDIENVFNAYKEKALHDESIQYYVRIYLEHAYGIER
jgi:hypothetical protein